VVSDPVIWNSLPFEECGVCIGIIHAITLVGEDPRLGAQYSHKAYTARCSDVLSFVAL
jgi:hypothetical protein